MKAKKQKLLRKLSKTVRGSAKLAGAGTVLTIVPTKGKSIAGAIYCTVVKINGKLVENHAEPMKLFFDASYPTSAHGISWQCPKSEHAPEKHGVHVLSWHGTSDWIPVGNDIKCAIAKVKQESGGLEHAGRIQWEHR